MIIMTDTGFGRPYTWVPSPVIPGMNHTPALHLIKGTGSLWQLSLVLLLLCGVVSWVGIDSRSPSATPNADFVIEQNQLALARFSDNLRVRPVKGKPDQKSGGDEPTETGLATGLVVFSIWRSASLPDNLLAVHAPRTFKYLLQAPRAPPLA